MAKAVRTDIGPFAIVPLWLIQDASPRALRIYAVMAAKWADRDTGECFPFRQTIADEIGVSADTVDRGLVELEGMGAIEIKPQYDSKGDQTCNLYRLFTVPNPGRESAATPPQNSGDPSSDLRGPGREDAAAGERESFDENHIPSLPQPREAGGEEYGTGLTTTGTIQEPSDTSGTLVSGPASHPSPIASPTEDGMPTEHGPEGDSTGRLPEYVALCHLLADLIAERGEKRPNPDLKKWYDAVRLLVEKDGYTVEQVEIIIRWAQADEFWHSNILSTPKLRTQFTQLRLKRNSTLEKKSGGNKTKYQSDMDRLNAAIAAESEAS